MNQITTNHVAALRLLEHNPICAERIELDCIVHSGEFRALGTGQTLEDFSKFGQALGAFQLAHKGQDLPGLGLHDAAWFSRAAPYVLAEVASLAERGEYQLSLAQSGQLEEAGIMLAELSEPLTGLFSSFVHGDCILQNAGFVEGRPCLRNWQQATCGFPWLDLASLSDGVEKLPDGVFAQEALVALVSSYAEAADYPVGVVGDLVPFSRALHDLYVLDLWNHQLSSGELVAGHVRHEASARIGRLLELTGA